MLLIGAVVVIVLAMGWIINEGSAPKWESTGEPGREGNPRPRNPTPEEQAKHDVPGPKPVDKEAKPIGKDNSR